MSDCGKSKVLKYDFDQVIPRRGTNSSKWDTGGADVLPMWVADMDFAIAKPISDALKKRADHPVLGYSIAPPEYYQSVINWFERRHHWKIEREWFAHSPGIVPALHFLVKTYLKRGDKILLQYPVYYPFFGAAQKNQINIAENRLLYQNGRYEIDFADFETKAKEPDVKLFYLCSPHNPGGRIWTREELKKMAEICITNNVIIVSDEIHCDLVFPGNKHIPLASISNEIAQHTISCVAPSKTFNLAGLQTSCLIIPNPTLKGVYEKFLDSLGIMRPNAFGIAALIAAFQEGEEWLEELLVYLKGNLDYVRNYLKENIPEIKIMEPDATYLIWLDFTGLKIDSRTFHELLLKKGKVWLDEGYMFGQSGEGFERINIACPRVTLEEGLRRINFAIKG